jgi:putative ABC transport system permease protein
MNRYLKNLDREIRDHIERETLANIERGMSPEDARAAALRAFGNITSVTEQTREVWILRWLEQLWQDVRYGIRMLLRNPGFTAVVVLTLALGIGMNTAVFSVVNAVLLRPIGYPHPDRLVWLGDYDTFLKRDLVRTSDFLAWREEAQSFSAMAAYGRQQTAIATARGATNVNGIVVGGDFWAITGARPALGRLFRPEEQNAIVLAWDLFEREFSSDARMIGQTVMLDGRAAIITGVLPKNFRLEFPRWWIVSERQPVEAYLPLVTSNRERLLGGVQVVGTLKPGLGTRQGLAELEVLEKPLLNLRPSRDRANLHVEALQEQLAGNARPALLVLFAAGVFVLMIATVNIMNLLLARATARRKEIAIRASVGAGRARVIRQFLTESLVMALLGGAAGLALARGAIALLIRISPNAAPRLEETSIDGWVLAFTIAISAGAGVVFGVGPAIALWRSNLHGALKESARTSAGASGLRVRRLLVAGELALAIVLLTGAGLMLKSFWLMNTHPPGFSPESVLLVKVRPRFTTKEAQTAYLNQLIERVESAPQVDAAGISMWVAFSGVPAFPIDSTPGQTHTVRLNFVSPGFLKAMRATLVKGRPLTDTDLPNMILLNESFSREAFGAADPVGHELRLNQTFTIAGVVSDVKYSKLDAAPPPEAYLPFRQLPMLPGLAIDLAVRTEGDPLAVATGIRKLISEIDPSQPVYGVTTLDRALSDSIAPRRFNLFVFGTFAVTALLLALIGIYGVIAYSIAQRTHEIGIRMALGAQRTEVVGMIARDGMIIALAGMVIGFAAAAGLTRLMASLLYDVKPADPTTFAAVAAALAVAALVACWGTALKAALVDPMVALRTE